jgi:hypothetical protein
MKEGDVGETFQDMEGKEGRGTNAKNKQGKGKGKLEK